MKQKDLEKSVEGKIRGRSRLRDNRGISLIEILVGIAILSVVGLMAGSFLGMSSKLGRKTAVYADIQKESQSVMKRLTDGVMNAESIYIQEDSGGTVIFFGKRVVMTDTTNYAGETFFFDKSAHSIYQVRKGDFRVDGAGDLDSTAVKAAMCSREYLVSDKLDSIAVNLGIDGKGREEANGFKEADGPVTVEFELEFSYQDVDPYKSSSGATARNMPELVWYQR